MPYPTKEETKEEFIARFMASEEARSDYPDEKQRAAVAYSLWENRGKAKNATMVLPRKVTIRHLEDGPVHYEYLNDGKGATILVTRGLMDRMRQSLVGKPIINRAHRDISPNSYKAGEADGIITHAYNNPAD